MTSLLQACLPGGWLVLMLAGGCASPQPRTPDDVPKPVLQVVHHIGGANERVIVGRSRWYQTHGNTLLVLNREGAQTVHTIELAGTRSPGVAVDLVLHDDRAYVVLKDHSVVELSLPADSEPAVLRSILSEELRIAPRRLSVVSGEVFVSGIGGVVRLRDLERVFDCEGPAGRVAPGEHGLVTTVGRRVHALDDGRYLGSATDLQPLQRGDSTPAADRLLFVRQGQESAAVGLMTRGIRELNTAETTVTVPGTVHRARVFDGRVWIITDEQVIAFALSDWRLSLRARIDIGGVRDVDRIGDNYLALVGTFGRATYRLLDDEHGPGGETRYLERQPGLIRRARFDGRHVLADCDNGLWLYDTVSNQARPADPHLISESAITDWEPAREAVGLVGTATIDETGEWVLIRGGGEVRRYAEPDGKRLHCLASVGGEVWVGHDGGLTVLSLAPSNANRSVTAQPPVKASGLHLPSDVRYVFPMPDGERAAFVCASGVMGVAECATQPE